MLDKFKKLGELKKLRDQAVALKKALAKEEVVIEEGEVKIVIGGDQKFRQVIFRGETSKSLIDALNKAIKKSQELAAKKLRSMGGDFGLPGL